MKELTPETEACLALGYFDSMHLGHRRIIEEMCGFAAELGLASCVATFSNNAYKLFNREEKAVYTYAERCTLLEGTCDCVLPIKFDKRLKETPAEKFLDEVFSAYSVKAVVCGYDHLFGAGAKGDAELLKAYCAAHGVPCRIIGKFELDGTRVSTTLVKELLAAGKVEDANRYLGTPFFATGKVVHGRGAGRMFDIPTANLKLPADKLLPATGVYGVECVVGDRTYKGAANVGARPTFGLSKAETEVMIDDFSDNIYDESITLRFIKYLRPVKRFDTPALLSKQVHEDIKWSDK